MRRFVWLLGALLPVGAALTLLATTAAGPGAVAFLVEYATALRVEGPGGTLFGRLRFDRVSDPGGGWMVEGLVIEPDWARLLDAEFKVDYLHADRVDLEADLTERVSASTEAAPGLAWPIDLRAVTVEELRYREGRARVAGSLRFDGRVDARFDVGAVDHQIELDVDGDLHALNLTARIEGEVSGEAVVSLAGGFEGSVDLVIGESIGVRGTATRTRSEFPFSLEVVDIAAGETWRAAGRFLPEGEVVDIIAEGSTPAGLPMKADARIDLSTGSPTGTLAAEIAETRWQVALRADVIEIDGRGGVDVTGSIGGAFAAAAMCRLAARSCSGRAVLSVDESEWLAVSFGETVIGAEGWRSPIAVERDARTIASGHVVGRRTDGDTEIEFEIVGTLQDTAATRVRGGVRGLLRPNGDFDVEFDQLELSYDHNRAKASGSARRLGSEVIVTGDLDIDAESLDVFHPDLAGRVVGRIEISTHPRMRLRGALSGSELGWGDWRFDTVDAEIRDDRANVTVSSERFGRGLITYQDRRGAVDWQLAEHLASGRYVVLDDTFTTRIEALSYEHPLVGRWGLVEPFTVRPGERSFDDWCLAGLGELCLRSTEDRFAGDLRIRTMTLPLAGGSVEFTGTQASFALGRARADGSALVRVDNAVLAIDEAMLALRSIHGDIDIGDGMRAAFEAGGDASISGEASLEGGFDGRLSGRLAAAELPLAVIAPFVEPIARGIHGSGSGELVFRRDTDGVVVLNGTLAVTAAGASIVPLGVDLGDATIEAEGTDDGFVAAASGRVGAGSFNAQANGDWTGRIDAALIVNEALVYADGASSLVASGTLGYRVDGQIEAISGSVRAHDSRLVPRTLPNTAVHPSGDAIVVGREVRPRIEREVDITIELGNNVALNMLGLTSVLAGQLTITDSPSRAASVDGTVTLVDGRLMALGQELTIREGRLRFDGLIDDPFLDVVAAREARDGDRSIEVIVEIRGRARSPTTTVRTVPPIDQAYAVVALATGKVPRSSADTEIDINALLTTLAAQVPGRMIGVIGLKNVDIDANPDGVRVGVGRQITPNVYLRYDYDIFTRLGGMILRYDMGEGFGIRAEGGASSSVELEYTVER